MCQRFSKEATDRRRPQRTDSPFNYRFFSCQGSLHSRDIMKNYNPEFHSTWELCFILWYPGSGQSSLPSLYYVPRCEKYPMIHKRFIAILIIFILFTGSSAACSSGSKMVKRDDDGTSILTPFAPKATFTSTTSHLSMAGEKAASSPSQTATIGPTLSEETSQVVITIQVSSTVSLTPTPDKGLPEVSATTALDNTSATIEPVKVSATEAPNKTSASSTQTKPSATSNSSQPSATANPPTPTSTPLPPTATSVPTALPPPGGCTFSGNTSYENQVVELINQERTDRGLPALVQNSSLRAAARRHSEDMACNDIFSHIGSDGSTFSSRMLDAGYSYSWAAENIAASSSSSFSAQAVVSMWMNSTGHRKNILSENAIHIGVGFRYAGDGDTGDLDAYYTADFGRP